MRLSSNMIGNSAYETNFPHKLLLTNRQIGNIRNFFANNLLTFIKLSKAQLPKIMQSGGITLGSTVATSTADTGIHEKISGSEKKQH